MAAKDEPALAALYGMPGHLIRRAHQISTALFAEKCGQFDVTSVQYAALFAIRAAGELDATRLADRIALDRATTGDVVERMEAKGWVARTPSPTDKRIKVIRLTAAGKQLMRQIEPAVQKVQDGLLEPFSRDERAALLKLLTKLDRLDRNLNPQA